MTRFWKITLVFVIGATAFTYGVVSSQSNKTDSETTTTEQDQAHPEDASQAQPQTDKPNTQYHPKTENTELPSEKITDLKNRLEEILKNAMMDNYVHPSIPSVEVLERKTEGLGDITQERLPDGTHVERWYEGSDLLLKEEYTTQTGEKIGRTFYEYGNVSGAQSTNASGISVTLHLNLLGWRTDIQIQLPDGSAFYKNYGENGVEVDSYYTSPSGQSTKL